MINNQGFSLVFRLLQCVLFPCFLTNKGWIFESLGKVEYQKLAEGQCKKIMVDRREGGSTKMVMADTEKLGIL